MISRRGLLIGAGAALVAGAVRGADTARVLTAADVHTLGYPTVEAVRWLGHELERETGGALTIRLYHAGQLGRESDTIDMVRYRALDMTRVNMGALNNPFPATRVLCLPYVFDDVPHMRRAVDGAVGRELLDGFARRGLVGLAFYDSGLRNFYNARRAVTVPADLHGLKIRVPPSDVFMSMARALGANPTPLAFGEVFSAMQTGLIDGAENNWQSLLTTRQFEVARHCALSGHCFSPDALLLSQRTYDTLTPRQQELMRDLGRRSVLHMRELWDRAEAEAQARVVASGVAVTAIDADAFRQASAPLVTDFRRDADIDRLYRAIRELA